MSSKSSSSYSLSSKQKQVAELHLAEMAKKNEERRQRDDRAACSARNAILREAAQREANERLEQIENRLAVSNMERKIELAAEKVKAWYEASSVKTAKGS